MHYYEKNERTFKVGEGRRGGPEVDAVALVKHHHLVEQVKHLLAGLRGGKGAEAKAAIDPPDSAQPQLRCQRHGPKRAAT